MKKSNYKKITAVLLVLLLVLGICPGTAFAEPAQTSHPSGSLEPTETAQPIQADDEATRMEETVSAEAFSPLIPIDEEPAAGINATAATASTASATIADGIYAFKNITNTGRWMDTQYDSTQAGYHMQQYAYNPSPATSSALYALFKVTHAGSGRYIIRLMLNNELSFGVSGSDILTKTIAVDDSDVPTSDMFYINYDSASGGYTIEPCANPGYLVAARQTTASGSAGAPNSYLLAVPKSSSSSYSATWQPHVYTGPIDFGDVYPHYIPDGVYAFANVNNDGLWMDTQQDKILPGYHIQQYAYPTNPTEAFERGGLFKIKRDGTSNRYIIRSMLNNRMTMTTAGTYGTDIITEELTAYDDDVSTADMFYINYDATIGTYTVEPCSDPGYVIAARQTTASGASGAPNSFLTLVSKSSTSYSPDWFLHRYMGEDQAGGVASNSVHTAGITRTVTAISWSTVVGANEQYLYIGSDQANIATGTWSESDYKLYVSPHDEGDFRVFVDVRKNGVNAHRFAIDLRVELPVAEGTYFFQNASLDDFVQIATSDSPNYSTNGIKVEIRDLAGGDYQKWNLIHTTDGVYKIKSVQSELVLSVADTSTYSYYTIVQENDVNATRQLWTFSQTNSENYAIRPLSGVANNYCMVASGGILTDDGYGIVQSVYTNDTDYHDEWILHRMLPLCGYELDYMPELWGGIVGNNCNCYAYAINNQIDKEGNLIYKQQPGQYAGYEDVTVDADEIITRVLDDFEEFNNENLTNLVFKPIGRYESCTTIGAYKIALVIAPGYDYHWYRQDSDGLWSHKPGTTPVTRFDNSNDLIIDPQTANRGLYTEFIGYFEVIPWNQYYSSIMSNTSNANIITQANDNQHVVEATNVHKVEIGMTYEKVCNLLGSAGVDIGYGAILYQYLLDDSSTVILNFYRNSEGELILCNIIYP